MNSGPITVILPRLATTREHDAVQRLEQLAPRIAPFQLSFRSGCIWVAKIGQLEVRHEDFATCVDEFIKKVTP